MQNSVFDVRGASAAPTASVPLTGDDEPVAPAASTASVPLTGAPPDPTITESQEHGDAKESVADQVVRTTLDKFDTFWWNPCQDQKTPGTLMQPNSKLLQSLRLSYSIAAWAQVHAQHNAAFMKKVEVSQATGMKNLLTFKMQGVCPDFNLNLAADSSDITFSPTPGSLKIGSIGKLDMYMQAPGSDSCPCIAWLIPTSQDAEEVTVQLIKNEEVVNCKNGAKSATIPMDFYCLQPVQSVVGTNDVVLVRAPFPKVTDKKPKKKRSFFEIVGEIAGVSPAPKKSKSETNKGGKNGAAHQNDKFAHLAVM